MPSQMGPTPSKLCKSLLILAELEAAAKLESLGLALCRVPSLSGRGARASEQKEQTSISAAQGGQLRQHQRASRELCSSSQQATLWSLLRAPRVAELGPGTAEPPHQGNAARAATAWGLAGGLVRAQVTQALPRDTLTAGGKAEKRMGWPWSLLLTWGHSLVLHLRHP